MKHLRRWMLGLVTALFTVALISGCTSGNETAQPTESTKDVSREEQFIEREEGCNLLTFYVSGDLKEETSDVWIWWDGKDGSGYLFSPCEYGLKCMVNVPEEIEEVGFIVRKNCSDPGGSSWGEATKDFEEDRFAVMTGENTVIYLKSGDGGQYESSDGGKTLSEIRLYRLAGLISPTEIKYSVSPAKKIESLSEVEVLDEEGRPVGIESLSSLNNEVVTGVVKVKTPLDLTKTYTLSIQGYGKQTVTPTAIFDSDAFREEYLYDGDDLGATVRGEYTEFKVWAPTASKVELNLYETGDGTEPFESRLMERDEKGIFRLNVKCGSGTYYTYKVTTASGTNEVVDPYAKAVGVNGNRGMTIDLRTTDPEGFRADTFRTGLSSYEDASIYEVHVRDFSNAIASSAYPGKYLAFTEGGLKNSAGEAIGMDYLKTLGITHIHLQPVYDFATVDETKGDEFNWGYDPKNYNVPEGSYSTDPYNGEVRIREFKQMVQAIHDAGMGVVMDVVYNHTYDGDSNLNRLVPYYYYRFTNTGAFSNGSGCGNETASEREMFRKFMIDSVTYWATEYHVDGFRFDLMALHDLETMQAIEEALHAINPECLIYGEGWTGGTTTLNQNRQTSQANISKIEASPGAIGGISVFNDSIRDGLKGSVFSEKEQGYISGNATKLNAYKVAFGLTGGDDHRATSWKVNRYGLINYMSCHDNLTLYDKLTVSCPDASAEEITGMYRLGAAAVLLSKGTPFFLGGEEMMRTKQGDSNSYKSSDEINNIDWEALKPDTDAYAMALYYRQVLKVRNTETFLRDPDVSVNAEVLEDMTLKAEFSKDGTALAYLILNPNLEESHVELPEGNYQCLIGACQKVTGETAISPKSAVLLKVE